MKLPTHLLLGFAVAALAANAARIRDGASVSPANGTAVAKAAVASVQGVVQRQRMRGWQATNMSANASANTSQPFQARVDPAVAKVWALYYSSVSGEKATQIEVWPTESEQYVAAAVPDGDDSIWDPAEPSGALPQPSCNLRIRTQTNYPTDRREANYRLAEIAVCNLVGDLPSCGATGDQICMLKLMAPIPASDEHQEPYIAAAMALVSFSKLCALGRDSYKASECNIYRSQVALTGGLSGGGDLRPLPSVGAIDLKMEAAYELGFKTVYLPSDNEEDYEKTQHYEDSMDVTKWQRAPPEAEFCGNLACLVQKLMPDSGYY